MAIRPLLAFAAVAPQRGRVAEMRVITAIKKIEGASTRAVFGLGQRPREKNERLPGGSDGYGPAPWKKYADASPAGVVVWASALQGVS